MPRPSPHTAPVGTRHGLDLEVDPPRHGEPKDDDDVAMLALRSAAVHCPDVLGLVIALTIAQRH